jgi:hypothetical protein
VADRVTPWRRAIAACHGLGPHIRMPPYLFDGTDAETCISRPDLVHCAFQCQWSGESPGLPDRSPPLGLLQENRLDGTRARVRHQRSFLLSARLSGAWLASSDGLSCVPAGLRGGSRSSEQCRNPCPARRASLVFFSRWGGVRRATRRWVVLTERPGGRLNT